MLNEFFYGSKLNFVVKLINFHPTFFSLKFGRGGLDWFELRFNTDKLRHQFPTNKMHAIVGQTYSLLVVAIAATATATRPLFSVKNMPAHTSYVNADIYIIHKTLSLHLSKFFSFASVSSSDLALKSFLPPSSYLK